ncbi:hypothetical protein ABMA27_011234 [Loxostege sticticalis]|uniref:Pseudouridine synthase I TruA alpha/beta domain-containing protein n=1 Tax=Loxostege sticticalis TaxID=481309 RepID=A0ABR3H1S1_LOXSC
MANKPPKLKKNQGLTKEELSELDKMELVERVIKLEAHNKQLKDILSRNLSDSSKSEKNAKRPFDFSKCHYRRILLRIMYFGWEYQGLAVQEGTIQTIEHHLFHALTKACLIESRETSSYHRCGRTDKGVSSFGQVISISLRSNSPPELQHEQSSIESELAYCKILNRILPKDIRAVAWMPIPDDKPEYSSRFDCKQRSYKYYFPRSALSIPSMRRACTYLVGSHDYRHLCKMDVANGVTEFRREIFKADIVPVAGDSDDPTAMYCLIIEGNAFLWHQIRCIMGVLLLVGQGNEQPEVISELLDVDKNPRKPQYNMALDVPLNLFHCTYDLERETRWVYSKDELRSLISHLQGEWTIQNVKSTMMKDSLQQLETEYSKLCASETDNSENDKIMSHTDCLLQGVKPRVYTPLLKRQTCSSLDERIEHYKKKRKIGGNIEENK